VIILKLSNLRKTLYLF